MSELSKKYDHHLVENPETYQNWRSVKNSIFNRYSTSKRNWQTAPGPCS